MYNKIYQLMKVKGITAYRLSKEIDVSEGNISEWKKGNAKTPRSDVVAKIASYFGVSADYLLDLPQSNIQSIYDALSPERKKRVLDNAQLELDEQNLEQASNTEKNASNS